MRAFAPLRADHPLVTSGERCPFCRFAFRAGDVTALIATAPADAEEAEKARAGRAYTAVAAPVHHACVPTESEQTMSTTNQRHALMAFAELEQAVAHCSMAAACVDDADLADVILTARAAVVRAVDALVPHAGLRLTDAPESE